MDTVSIKNNEQMLDLASLVAFNRAVGNCNAIEALYDTMSSEFARYGNPTEGTHFITDVMTSAMKSDSIKTYVSKLVKLCMNVQFADLKGFSNATLGSDNNVTMGIVTQLCTTQILSHRDLFNKVMVHICGYDSHLIDVVHQPTYYRRFRMLLVYVINKFSLANGYQPERDDKGNIVKDSYDLLLEGQLTEFAKDEQLCKVFFTHNVDIVTEAIDRRFNNSRLSVLNAVLNATKAKAKVVNGTGAK